MEALKAATKEKVGMELILHAKPKGEDGQQQVDDLVETVKASSGPLGVIQKVRSDPLIHMREAVRPQSRLSCTNDNAMQIHQLVLQNQRQISVVCCAAL